MGSEQVDSIEVGLVLKTDNFAPALNAAGAAVDNFESKVSGVGDKISKSFSDPLKNLGSTVKTAFSGVESAVSSSTSNIKTIVQGSFSGIDTTIRTSLSGVKSEVSNAFSGVSSSIQTSLGNIKSIVQNAFSGIKQEINNAFSGAGNVSGLSNIRSSITTAFSNISGIVRESLAGVKTEISNAFTGSSSAVSSSINNIKTIISGGFSGVGGIVRQSLAGVKTEIVNAFSGAAQAVTAPINQMKTAIAGGIDSVAQLGQMDKKVSPAMQAIGAAITTYVTSKLVELGKQITDTFKNFDDQMRKVQAVTGAPADEYDKLTKQAKMLGATTSFDAQDAAEAMTYLGQAGFNVNQVYAAMPATLNLARASMTELGTTADIMSNIMNGFQIPAEQTGRAADVLSKAANATNTDVRGLGEAMKYAAPLAHQMGWSLEETAAAAGMLSNAGIKNDMAGTVIRNAITRLIAPTKNVTEALAAYGISVDDVNPKTKSLADILDVLGQKGVSSGALMTIFGMRAGPGMMALVNQGTQALREMEMTLENSGGYAKKAADEMDAGWGGVTRRFDDMKEALSLSFGKNLTDMIAPFVDAISKIGIALSQIPDWAQKGIVAMAGIATVLGTVGAAVLVAVPLIGSLGAAFDAIVAASPAISAALGTLGLGVTFGSFVTGIGEAVVAIGLLVAALALIEEKTKIFSTSWQALKDVFTIVSDSAKTTFDNISNAWNNFSVSGTFESLKTGLTNALNDIKKAWSDFSLVDTVKNWLPTDWTAQLTSWINGAKEILNNIKTEFQNFSLVDTVKSWLPADWSSTLTEWVNGAKGILDNIKTEWANFSLVDTIKGWLPADWKEPFQNLVNSVTESFNDIKSAFANFSLVDTIKGWLPTDWKQPFQDLANSINESLGSATFDDFKQAVTDMKNWIIQELQAIKDAFANVIPEQFKSGVQSLKDFFKGSESGDQEYSLHDRAEAIRARDERKATQEENVQKQIDRAKSGSTDDFKATHTASGESYANMIQTAINNGVDEATEEAVTKATSTTPKISTTPKSSGSSYVSAAAAGKSTSKTKKEESVPTTFAQEQTDIARIASANPLRALESNPLSKNAEALNKGLQLADGNTLKLNKSGELTIQTFDGVEKKVDDIKTALDSNSSSNNQYASSLAQIQKGIKLSNGNILEMDKSGKLVIQTADGVQKSISSVEKTTESSAANTKTYASTIQEVRNGIDLANGNILTFDKNNKLIIEDAKGIEKSFSSVKNAVAGGDDEAKKYASSMDLINKGITLADGNTLKLNQSGQLVVQTGAGIEKTFTSINTATQKSAENTQQYGASFQQLQQGIQLTDGNVLKLDSSNKLVIQSANGITRSYDEISKANEKNTELNSKYAADIKQIEQGFTLADGSVIKFNSSGQASITTVDGITNSVKNLNDELKQVSSGKANMLDMDQLNKGVPLSEDRTLKFNDSGELIVEYKDKNQQSLREIGNTSLKTKEGKQIDIIGLPPSEEQAKEPPKTFEQKAKEYQDELKYAEGPEGTAQRWADLTGHTVIDMRKKPIPKNKYFNEKELAKIESGEWTAPIKTPTESKFVPTDAERLKAAKEKEEASKRATGYYDRLKEQNAEKAAENAGDVPWNIFNRKDSADRSWLSKFMMGGLVKDTEGKQPVAAGAGGDLSGLADNLSKISGIKLPDLSSLKMPELPDISGFTSKLSELSNIKLPDLSSFKLPDLSSIQLPDLSGIKASFDGLVQGISTSLSGLPNTINSALNGLPSTISSTLSSIPSTISSVFDQIPTTVSTALSQLPNTVNSALGGIPSTVSSTLSSLPSTVSSIFEQIPTTVSNILTQLPTTVSSILSPIPTEVSNLLSSLPTTVSGIMQTLVTEWTNKWTELQAATDTASTNVQTALATLITNIQTKFSEIVQGVQTLIQEWSTKWQELVTATDTAANNVVTALTTMATNIKAKFDEIITNIQTLIQNWSTKWQEMVTTVTTKGQEIITAIGTMITGLQTKATEAYNAAADIGQKIVDGLASKIDAVKSTASELWNAASTATSGVVSKGVNTAKNVANKVGTTYSNTVDAYNPHSPAKKGAFRRLPNWNVIFYDPLKQAIAKTASLEAPLDSVLSTFSKAFPAAKYNVGIDTKGASAALKQLNTDAKKQPVEPQVQSLSSFLDQKASIFNTQPANSATQKALESVSDTMYKELDKIKVVADNSSDLGYKFISNFGTGMSKGQSEAVDTANTALKAISAEMQNTSTTSKGTSTSLTDTSTSCDKVKTSCDSASPACQKISSDLNNISSSCKSATTGLNELSTGSTAASTCNKQLNDSIAATPTACNTATTCHKQLNDTIATAPTSCNTATTCHKQLTDTITTEPTSCNAATTAHQQLNSTIAATPTSCNTATTGHQQLNTEINTAPTSCTAATTAHQQLNSTIATEPTTCTTAATGHQQLNSAIAATPTACATAAQAHQQLDTSIASVPTTCANATAGLQNIQNGLQQTGTACQNTTQASSNMGTGVQQSASTATNALNQLNSINLSGLISSLQAVVPQLQQVATAAVNAANSISTALNSSLNKGLTQAQNTAETQLQGVRDLLPASPAKRGPFRILPDWDMAFFHPMNRSIRRTGGLFAPFSHLMDRFRRKSGWRGRGFGENQNQKVMHNEEETGGASDYADETSSYSDSSSDLADSSDDDVAGLDATAAAGDRATSSLNNTASACNSLNTGLSNTYTAADTTTASMDAETQSCDGVTTSFDTNSQSCQNLTQNLNNLSAAYQNTAASANTCNSATGNMSTTAADSQSTTSGAYTGLSDVATTAGDTCTSVADNFNTAVNTAGTTCTDVTNNCANAVSTAGSSLSAVGAQVGQTVGQVSSDCSQMASGVATSSNQSVTNLDSINGVSFDGLNTSLQSIITQMDAVVQAAANMYQQVQNYASQAQSSLSSINSGSTSGDTYNTTNNNVGTINNNGDSVSSNAMDTALAANA